MVFYFLFFIYIYDGVLNNTGGGFACFVHGGRQLGRGGGMSGCGIGGDVYVWGFESY